MITEKEYLAMGDIERNVFIATHLLRCEFRNGWQCTGAIIERMQELGWEYSIGFSQRKQHWCEFYKAHKVEDDAYTVSAFESRDDFTTHLAVQLAALKALGKIKGTEE